MTRHEAGPAAPLATWRPGDAQPMDFLQYLATSDFAVDVTENWQSEY